MAHPRYQRERPRFALGEEAEPAAIDGGALLTLTMFQEGWCMRAARAVRAKLACWCDNHSLTRNNMRARAGVQEPGEARQSLADQYKGSLLLQIGLPLLTLASMGQGIWVEWVCGHMGLLCA